MRVFIGFDLDEEIRAKIARFLEGACELAPDARWVNAESLHVTLKFIGEQKPEQVEAITMRLRGIRAKAPDIPFTGSGFFPNARAARVFWLGIKASPELAELALSVDSAMAELGIPREERSYTPHLTLARRGRGSGAPGLRKGDKANLTFSLLEKRLGTLSDLDFGTMTPREFFLYQSHLSPKGSKYTKLQSFPLK
jgi:RNA 2',3'-cyclic 3'-phosphodiesterase